MHALPHASACCTLTSLVNERGWRERVRATCNAIKKVVFSDYSLCAVVEVVGMARCMDKHGIFQEREGVE